MCDIKTLSKALPGVSSEARGQFVRYCDLIKKYNLRMNLISCSALSEVVPKHLVDSYLGIQVLEHLNAEAPPVFDFGSGNGFPGIVAAVLRPDLNFILVDRDQRKAEFLKIAYSHLGLSNVEVHPGNITDLGDSTCLLAMSRAMAPIPRFLLEARSCVGVGGKVFLFKGENWTTELSECSPQMFDYWSVKMVKEYKLPDKGESERFIVECLRIE